MSKEAPRATAKRCDHYELSNGACRRPPTVDKSCKSIYDKEVRLGGRFASRPPLLFDSIEVPRCTNAAQAAI